MLVALRHGGAGEQHAEAGGGGEPVRLGHLPALRGEPGQVRLPPGNGGAAGEERPLAQDGVAAAQPHDAGGEIAQGAPAGVVQQRPVDPADLVVLAVRVVVAALGAAELVAGGEHRDAGGEQQGGEQVPQLALAQGDDAGVGALALGSAVPGAVVVGPVPVVLAVRLVVLLLVADQVAQGVAVVRGHEVHGRVGAPAAALVEVGGAGEPVAEFTDVRPGAAPEVPDGVAVPVVPLGPERGEAADLVAAGADVPRLGDQFDPAEHRVLGDGGQEGVVHLDAVAAPGERGGEVEAEAVDPHLGDPVAQRVGDQPDGLRLAGVERVAAAGVVGVAAPPVQREPVVAGVVDPAQGQRRAEFAGLGGVVVDDVEDDLEPGRVQGADHPLELADLLAPAAGGRVAGVRREVADAVVAPVVRQVPGLEVVLAGVLVDRQ